MDYSLLFAIEKFTRETIIGHDAAQTFAINDEEEPIRSESFKKREQKERDDHSFFDGNNQLITPKSRATISSRKSLNTYLKSKGLGESKFGRHQFLSADGKYIYHISIIDYLQTWNCNKMSEAFAKTWFLNKNKWGISCIPPVPYEERFVSFM